MASANRDDDVLTPLWAVLVVSALCSFGTGVFFNAISFVAKHGYDFSQERTLVLYLIMGALYMTGAARAGRLTRRCERWASPRVLLAVSIAVQAVVCLGPVLVAGEWALWVAVLGVTVAISFVWPMIESYLTAGRHGGAMRSAIGWFNLVWMTAVATPLFLMPPILARHAEWAVGAMAGVNLVALLPLVWFAPRPGRHDPEIADANVPEAYPLLLRCARVLLPISYVINAVLIPILPYRFEAIGAAIRLETPTTATWMMVRLVTTLLMWRVGFWHGRWGSLLLAGVALAAGFALVVLAPTLPVMVIGFAVFGVGMGVVYYAALYYGMAVGRAAIDAGGTHEALIGAGYAVGPALGLIGITAAISARSRGFELADGTAIVALVWVLMAVGALPALRPYLRARMIRKG